MALVPAHERGHAPTFNAWYREQVLPRLTPEIVFSGLELRGPGRERRAACPLHGGRNRTTLAVNVDTLQWTCHAGCGGGDALQWIAVTAGIVRSDEPLQGAAFHAAVRLLADRIGVALPGAAPLSPAERENVERTRAGWQAAAAAAQAKAAAADARAQAVKHTAAGALWGSATPDAAVLGRYLQQRCCWPPRALVMEWGLPPTPPRCRFASRPAIARATSPLTSHGRGWPLSPEAAGAVIYAYAHPDAGGLVALQLDAVSADGRHPLARWRRGIGSRRSGAVFRVRGRAGRDGWTAICEGEVTAMAIAAACPQVGEARAVGGAEGLTPDAVAGAARIWLVGDADPPSQRGRRPGPAAMDRLARELTAAGRPVRMTVIPGAGGQDYADLLAAQIQDRTNAGQRRGLSQGAATEQAWRRLGAPETEAIA